MTTHSCHWWHIWLPKCRCLEGPLLIVCLCGHVVVILQSVFLWISICVCVPSASGWQLQFLLIQAFCDACVPVKVCLMNVFHMQDVYVSSHSVLLCVCLNVYVWLCAYLSIGGSILYIHNKSLTMKTFSIRHGWPRKVTSTLLFLFKLLHQLTML